jgi:hypothetical protein
VAGNQARRRVGALRRAVAAAHAPPRFRMRFQIQWDNVTYSSVATTDDDGGVTVEMALARLEEAWQKVQPRGMRNASRAAVDAQRAWIAARPQLGGVGPGPSQHPKYFASGRARGCRVCVENLAGHNLRT